MKTNFLSFFLVIFVCMTSCSDDLIEPIPPPPPPPPPLSSECDLIAFGFNKEFNSGIEQGYHANIQDGYDTIIFNFTHFSDIKNLTASFEISAGATLYIDTVEQYSDTSLNDYSKVISYRILAENDSSESYFFVKTLYPLYFRTIGYSNDSSRIGAGDFVKPELYKVENIRNGQWKYKLIIGEYEYSDQVICDDNYFDIPNFITEQTWLNMNEGVDFSIPATLYLSCDSLNISDSIFIHTVNREQYTIRSWQDLQAVRYDLHGNYTMEKDVYFPLPGTYSFPAEGFIPIGDSLKRPFTGDFDGKNHVIYDFFIRRNSDTARYLGLFGVIERKMDRVPIIKNLGIIIADRDERSGINGGWFSGGIAGWNEGKIINCFVKGDISTDSPEEEPGAVGGLVGCNWGGTIERSSASGGDIKGSIIAGGLVGENTSDGIIERSCSRNTVQVTGLESFNNQQLAVGGFVGENTLGGTILNCYATGAVSGRIGVGGFVGRHTTISIIKTSYTSSKVSEINGNHSVSVGGFAGEVSGAEDRRSITDCYWSIGANPGLDGVGDGVIEGIDGRSDRDFMSADMFLGWDMPFVWDIKSGINNGKAHLVDVKGQEDSP